jgi:hypothetical protein
MAEPSTVTVAVMSGAVGLASIFPGVDGNALIGAFAGAALVVVTSKDLNVLQRIAYMVISVVVGYLAHADVIKYSPITSSGVASFFAAALAIAVALQLIERVKEFDLLSLIRGKQ